MARIGKFLGAASAIAIASMAFTGAARADDPPKLSYSITLTALTDYLFRGISLTNNKPEVNPYIELDYGIGYLGFWISNIGDGNELNFNSLGPVEVDYYAGIRPTWNNINFDFAALYYTYNSRLPGVGLIDVSYVELQAKASTELAKDLNGYATFYYTPEQQNSPDPAIFATQETYTIEGGLSYALPKAYIFDPTVSGAAGYTAAPSGTGWFLGNDNYIYWNAGVKLAVDKWFMDFRYWDTNISEVGAVKADGRSAVGLADSRFLFSAGFTLGGP